MTNERYRFINNVKIVEQSDIVRGKYKQPNKRTVILNIKILASYPPKQLLDIITMFLFFKQWLYIA